MKNQSENRIFTRREIMQAAGAGLVLKLIGCGPVDSGNNGGNSRPTPTPYVSRDINLNAIQSGFTSSEETDMVSALDPRYEDKLVLYGFSADNLHYRPSTIPDFEYKIQEASVIPTFPTPRPRPAFRIFLKFPDITPYKNRKLWPWAFAYMTIDENSSMQSQDTLVCSPSLILESWDERSLSYNNSPRTEGAGETQYIHEKKPGELIGVKFKIEKWLRNPEQNHGVMIEVSTYYSSQSGSYRAVHSSRTSHSPYLELTPED